MIEPTEYRADEKASSGGNDSATCDPAYDHYLHQVLSEFGLQFSPKSTSVIDTAADPSPMNLGKLHEHEEAVEAKRQPNGMEDLMDTEKQLLGRKSVDRTAAFEYENPETSELSYGEIEYPTATTPESKLEIDEGHDSEIGEGDPFTEASDDGQPKKRVKLYEKPPLPDKVMELRRIRAITAKKNRDQWKGKMETLEESTRKQKHIISQCSKVFRRTQSDIIKLQEELKVANISRAELEDVVKQKEENNRNLRERLTLIQGHLDIIADSLDSDNPARRLLQSMLDRLSAQSASSSTSS